MLLQAITRHDYPTGTPRHAGAIYVARDVDARILILLELSRLAPEAAAGLPTPTPPAAASKPARKR